MAISARESLQYATHGELLKLYGVIVGGWALTILGQILTNSMRHPAAATIGIILLIAGVVVSVAAIVATAHKVIAESTENKS